MKLVDKYIYKQVALATTIALITFIVVWISPEILFKIIKKTIDGQITGLMALKLFFLQIPEILGTLIPASLMLGSLWVFDQLSRNSEITILRGIGISFYRLIIPVITLSLFGMASCFIVYEYCIPKSTTSLKILKQKVSKNHFVYVDKTKEGKPKDILIVGNYDGKKVENLVLLNFSDKISENTPIMKSIITASKGKWGIDHWTFEKGIKYQMAPDGVYKSIDSFDSLAVLSPESSQKAYKLLNYSTKKAKEMNMAELKSYIKLLKSVDLEDEYRYMLNKLYQRFSQSFSCILFAICGAVLGFSRPREKKILGFTIGVALIFLCLIIQPFIEMLAQIGILGPAVAAWTPNIIIFCSFIALVKFKQI